MAEVLSVRHSDALLVVCTSRLALTANRASTSKCCVSDGSFHCNLQILNRPRKLNALNLNMVNILSKTLSSCESPDGAKLVVMKGAGDRAFCAGGDVASVYVRTGGQHWYRPSSIIHPLVYDNRCVDGVARANEAAPKGPLLSHSFFYQVIYFSLVDIVVSAKPFSLRISSLLLQEYLLNHLIATFSRVQV